MTLEGSTVTLDLLPDSDAALPTMTHVQFDSESSLDVQKGGWTAILDR